MACSYRCLFAAYGCLFGTTCCFYDLLVTFICIRAIQTNKTYMIDNQYTVDLSYEYFNHNNNIKYVGFDLFLSMYY